MKRLARLAPVCLLWGSVMVFGCNPAGPAAAPKSPSGHAADHDDDEDEHEHHETFAEAVKELDGLQTAVKNGMADNNLDAAHEAVHEIGHILEELPGLAAKQTGAADEKTKQAIDDLFECFDSIDQKLEGSAGKTYDELAERIEASMATLRAKVE